MNGKDYIFRELAENQSRVYIDTALIFEAYRAALNQLDSYRGGMTWKTVRGRKYLVRILNRAGAQKGIGPYSEKTEHILKQFREGKDSAQNRLRGLEERLAEQARFCKAVRIQRVPAVTAGILRALDQNHLLGQNVVVIGANALYAYEMAAGVFWDRPAMETVGLDLLWDTRTRLVLGIDREVPRAGIMGTLKKIDRSFSPIATGSFRVVNRDGYRVDLIHTLPDPIPQISQTVIGEDGVPAMLAVPDPRAFALHKLWLSRQADREPSKKKRDKAQALAVASIVVKYLPQYPFPSESLRMFPQEVFRGAEEHLADKTFLKGFEL